MPHRNKLTLTPKQRKREETEMICLLVEYKYIACVCLIREYGTCTVMVKQSLWRQLHQHQNQHLFDPFFMHIHSIIVYIYMIIIQLLSSRQFISGFHFCVEKFCVHFHFYIATNFTYLSDASDFVPEHHAACPQYSYNMKVDEDGWSVYICNH